MTLSTDSSLDIKFMALAMSEAKLAFAEDEIPVGAVLVKGNQVIWTDHNRTRQQSNPLAHAEKLIIDNILNTEIKYLYDYTLYVTLEPCLMCSGLIIWSRLGRLVFAAKDEKTGCVGSIYNTLKDIHFNHHPKVTSGVMAEEAGNILKEFFISKRKID